MKQIKHVGKIKSTGRRCVIVFRTLPNDPYNCLVVLTESLTPELHDAFFSVIESEAGQNASEISEILSRSMFPNGVKMLQYLHVSGLLVKVPTAHVDVTPNSSTTINLVDLNNTIAKQRGTSVEKLWGEQQPQELVKVQDVPESQTSKESRLETMLMEVAELKEKSEKLLAEALRLKASIEPAPVVEAAIEPAPVVEAAISKPKAAVTKKSVQTTKEK